MISKAFLKSSIIFTAGGALPMLASFLLLPFYTNFLSDIHYTQLLFYISVASVSQILFSFATDTYFGIRYSQLFNDAEQQKKFIKTTSLLLLCLGGAILLISAIGGHHLFKIIFSEEIGMEFWPYGFLSVLTGFFNSYFKTASIGLIYVGQASRFFRDNLINFLVSVVISVSGLYIFPGTLIGPIFGRLISGAIIFMLGLRVFGKLGGGEYDKTFLPELLRFCLPYLAYGICVWVLSGIDRYILQSHVNIRDLNSYDLVLKCFVGIEFLQNSLSAVIFPKVYDIWARNQQAQTTTESNRYFNVFTVVNIILLIIFCLLLPLLYDALIWKEHFHSAENYLAILSAGFACRSIVNFYLAAILFSKRSGLMLRIFGVSAFIQVVTAVVAVRYYGIEGALYAGVFTKIAQVGLFALFSKGVFTFRFNYFKILLLPLIYITVNVLHFAFVENYSYWYFLAELLAFGAIIAFLFSREIRNVLVGFGLIRAK